jgi:hypothetical protein
MNRGNTILQRYLSYFQYCVHEQGVDIFEITSDGMMLGFSEQ